MTPGLLFCCLGAGNLDFFPGRRLEKAEDEGRALEEDDALSDGLTACLFLIVRVGAIVHEELHVAASEEYDTSAASQSS